MALYLIVKVKKPPALLGALSRRGIPFCIKRNGIPRSYKYVFLPVRLKDGSQGQRMENFLGDDSVFSQVSGFTQPFT